MTQEKQTRELIRLESLWKIYRYGSVDVKALRGVNVSIREGEYVSIMGHSGSGKSTMLNILGCLDKPSQGSYWLDGQDVAKMEDDELSEIRCSTIGFIFQSFNLVPQLDVIENIQVPLYYAGWPEDESRGRAMEMAEKVGLADRIDHKPTQLSGGQQQRVAIARALASDPLLILADEPTGNLDTSTSREVLEILDGLSAEGVTLILVTHDPEVARHTQRVLYLVDGNFQKDGPPAEVLRR
ncbi:MAG TPA: ABC transporter ATP-binding protein [Candidatus Brocadiia bacterium]|nr:ABC transporter ATP-binding protein [Candidatus Brocadiia bacterium]